MIKHRRTEMVNLVVPFLSAFQVKIALSTLQLLAHHRRRGSDHILLVRRLGALGSCVRLRWDRPRPAMGNGRGLAGESNVNHEKEMHGVTRGWLTTR